MMEVKAGYMMEVKVGLGVMEVKAGLGVRAVKSGVEVRPVESVFGENRFCCENNESRPLCEKNESRVCSVCSRCSLRAGKSLRALHPVCLKSPNVAIQTVTMNVF